MSGIVPIELHPKLGEAAPPPPRVVIPTPPTGDIEAQTTSDFEYTQNIRRGIAATLTATSPMPNSKEDAQVLLQAMRDMDSQNIARLRVKVDEKAADNTAAAAAMVTQVLREVNPRMFAPSPGTRPDIVVEAKVIPEEISGTFKAVPGEMDTSPAQGNVADFFKKMRD